MTIKAQDIKQASAFYKMPKILFSSSDYSDLSGNAKLMYMLLFDRLDLSVKNNWLDEHGQVYQFYTIEQFMLDLNCSRQTVLNLKKELSDKGLLVEIRQGSTKPNRLYLRSLNFRQVKSKNQTSRGLKNRLHEVQKLDPINTDINKTDKSILMEQRGSGSNLYSIGELPTTPTPIHSQDFVTLYQSFEQETGRPLSPIQMEKLNDMLKDFRPDLIHEALKEAVSQGKANFAYIEAILKRWKSDNLLTVELVHNAKKSRTRSEEPKQPMSYEDWQPTAENPF